MLIKQMPDDLKAWIAAEAKRNHRSMSKEALAQLEAVRALCADGREIDLLLARFRALQCCPERR